MGLAAWCVLIVNACAFEAAAVFHPLSKTCSTAPNASCCVYRAKGLRPVQGFVFEDVGDASAPGSEAIAQLPALNITHQTAAASADVICLSDSDQDPLTGSEPARQAAPQILRAREPSRSTMVPVQPKSPLSAPCNSR